MPRNSYGNVKASTRLECGEQIPNLPVDLLGRGHGLRHFIAQQSAVTPAHPVDGHFHRAFAHSAFCANFGMLTRRRLAGEELLQRVKEFFPASVREFHPQPLEGLLQNGQRPLPVERFVGA